MGTTRGFEPDKVIKGFTPDDKEEKLDEDVFSTMDITAATQAAAKSTFDFVTENGKFTGETFGIIAGAMIGGVIGSAFPVVGTVGGSAIGAGTVRAGIEYARSAILGKDTPIFPQIPSIEKDVSGNRQLKFGPRSIVGQGVTEGAATYVAGKAIGLVGKGIGKGATALAKTRTGEVATKGAKRVIGKVARKITNTETSKKLTQFLTGMSKVLGNVPKHSKNAVYTDIAQKAEASVGVPEAVVKRVLSRGPTKVLGRFPITHSHVSLRTRKAVASALNSRMDAIRTEFTKKILPELKNASKTPNIAPVVGQWDDMVKQFYNRDAVKKTVSGAVKRLKITPGVVDTAYSVDQIDKYIFTNKIFTEPTALKIHRLKQLINRTIKNNAKLRESPDVLSRLYKINKSITKGLENTVPGYRGVSNRFRDMFAIEERLTHFSFKVGKETDIDDTVRLMVEYLRRDDILLNQSIDRLLTKGARTTFDAALDEASFVHFFRSQRALSQTATVGFRVPGTPFGFRPAVSHDPSGLIESLPEFARTGVSTVGRPIKGTLHRSFLSGMQGGVGSLRRLPALQKESK